MTLTPIDLTLADPITRPDADFRDSVITPVTFTSTLAPFAPADLTVTSSGTGLLNFNYNKTNAYGINVDNGAVWTGSNGFLVRLVPQTLGGPTDQTLPLALQYGAAPSDTVRVDLTLSNRGTQPISGTALYQYSAGAYPRSKAFTLAAGQTVLLGDAFAGAATSPGAGERTHSPAGHRRNGDGPLRLGAVGALSGQFGLVRPGRHGADPR